MGKEFTSGALMTKFASLLTAAILIPFPETTTLAPLPKPPPLPPPPEVLVFRMATSKGELGTGSLLNLTLKVEVKQKCYKEIPRTFTCA